MITDMETTTTTTTTIATGRTRRGSGFASPGAVRQNGGSLPVQVCNRCGREVVWATSSRTGRKYLVTVSYRRSGGGRYYIGSNIHTDEICLSVPVDAIASRRHHVRAVNRTLDRVVACLVKKTEANESVEEIIADIVDDCEWLAEKEAELLAEEQAFVERFGSEMSEMMETLVASRLMGMEE